MNFLPEEDYIQAINDNAGKEPRSIELIYAEYLLEGKYEDLLAEGWRVLIERGKEPTFRSWEGEFNGWNWFAYYEKYPGYSRGIDPAHTLPIEWYGDDDKRPDLIDGHPSYFDAMNAAAIAYVRHTYDPDYLKPVIHMEANRRTKLDLFCDTEQGEGPNGQILHRPIETNRVLYGSLRYLPEELPLIKDVIVSGKPINLVISLEGEETTSTSRVRFQHFQAHPIETGGEDLCNIEIEVRREDQPMEKKVCPDCKGEKGHPTDSGGTNPDGSWIEVWETCQLCAGKGVLP